MRGKKLFSIRTFLFLFSVTSICNADAPSETSFLVGACTHFSQGKGALPLNLEMLSQAGIMSIRDEAGWRSVEQRKGELSMPERYDRYVREAEEAGLQVLLILDYSNSFYDDGDRPQSPEAIEGFCRYAEFMVKHFGKRVRLYEVWNEWDIPIGLPRRHQEHDGKRNFGSSEAYVKLLKPVYERIKRVDPEITVIGGAPTSGAVNRGWLEGIVKRGALEYCDAISIHSYNYSAPFPGRSPENCSKWMDSVQAMLKRYNHDKPVPFYVTEMGWPTHAGKHGTDPHRSASYLARLYLLARTSPSFRGLWWYDFQDDGWNAEYNESNFGIVRPDLTPKPAYHVMADISGLVARGRFVKEIEHEHTGLRVLAFTYRSKDVWALWSEDNRDRQVILTHPGKPSEAVIHQAGHKPRTRSWGHRPWARNRGATLNSQQLSCVVGERPVLISGALAGVRVSKVTVLSKPGD